MQPSFNYDQLFNTIEELVLHHSPSGVEGEIDQLLMSRFKALGVEVWQDSAGNVIAKIAGGDSERVKDSTASRRAIAITAHKDEIGGDCQNSRRTKDVLKSVDLGVRFPWVYGEGVVDLLGDKQTISGILSFGSRHVSHESPQKAQQEDVPVRWEDAWIETKCTTAELEDAGVRPGTRMVIGKHRKRPVRLKDYIASYTLDNKASVAILLALAEQLKTPALIPIW
jgi:putative aminopeptidase FrvX